MTTIVSNFTTSGQILNLGGEDEVLMANWIWTPTIFQMRYISNNTVKWSYTIANYTCWGYEIHNSTIISLLFPATTDGTILLDVRTIVNSSSITMLNTQILACSNISHASYRGSKNYYAIFNGSLMQIFTYCQNCQSIWAINITNLNSFEFC